MSFPRPPSPQIPNSGAPIFYREPLPADSLPQEPTPRAGPPSIANTAVRSSQSPPTSPPPPPERPPQFAPLFALVSSSSSFSTSPSSGSSKGSSPTHHHPTVHYIFADDHDSDLLITAAALQTLDPDPSLPPSSDNGSPSNTPARPRRVGDGGREKGSGGGGGAMAATSPERFLIVDLDPTATRVVAARSMARDWQVFNADITPAPTWEGEERNSCETGQGKGDGGGGGRGLMLRVEGVGTRGVGEEEIRGAEVEEGLEKLAERYESRLGELRRVVEGVGGGQG